MGPRSRVALWEEGEVGKEEAPFFKARRNCSRDERGRRWEMRVVSKRVRRRGWGTLRALFWREALAYCPGKIGFPGGSGSLRFSLCTSNVLVQRALRLCEKGGGRVSKAE